MKTDFDTWEYPLNVVYTLDLADRKSIDNLLVNVNNNSITIEFLKIILSFSDVILENLSLPGFLFLL